MTARVRLAPMALAAALPLSGTLPLTGTTPATTESITVDVEGLRSTRGLIQACLTADSDTFPDCEKDPAALHVTVPAADGPGVVFRNVPQGRYAIALFHDENANGRLDKVLMVPTEGFGFSRDAPVHFGPPHFARACFQVGQHAEVERIRVRYIF